MCKPRNQLASLSGRGIHKVRLLGPERRHSAGLAESLQSGALFPLTLTLFPGEREQLSSAWEYSLDSEHFPVLSTGLPPPEEEGWGEGENRYQLNCYSLGRSEGVSRQHAGAPARGTPAAARVSAGSCPYWRQHGGKPLFYGHVSILRKARALLLTSRWRLARSGRELPLMAAVPPLVVRARRW
jgi:hypothetical protein